MISFVILNYNSFDQTIECINKIKSNETNKEYKIIVVDNNSLSNAQIKILEKLVDKLIINKDNVGFAKGNNIGINFAKQNYNPELVCCLNSDCYIRKDFIDKIFKIYKEEQFDLFGPKIISSDNNSWNPFPVIQLDTISERIKYYEKIDKYYNSPVLYLFLSIYLKLKIKKNNKNDKNGLERKSNIALHGCCITFSKEYLDKYEEPFDESTYLYHEEEFLYYRIKKDELKSLYDPSIVVEHLEGASTENTYKNKRQKDIFRNKYRIESLKKLQEIINK